MSPIVRNALLTIFFLLMGTFGYFLKEYLIMLVPFSLFLCALVSTKLLYLYYPKSLVQGSLHTFAYALSFLLFVLYTLLLSKNLSVVPVSLFCALIVLSVRFLFLALKPYMEETER